MATPRNSSTTAQDLLTEALDALDAHRLPVALRRAAAAQALTPRPAQQITGRIIEAQVAALRSKRTEARTRFERALASCTGAGVEPDTTLAEALHMAGLWWMDDGQDVRLAQRVLRQALASAPADDAGLRATITGSLGSALATAGDPAAGRQLIREALATTSAAAERAILLGELALIEAESDRWRAALTLSRQALRCAQQADVPEIDEVIQAQHALAYSLLAQGRSGEAGRLAHTCWRQAQRLGDPHWTWAIQRLLANVAVERDRPGEAARHLRTAIAAAETEAGRRSTLVAELRSELGALLMDRKPIEALRELEEAVTVLSRERGPWHEDTREALRCAARALAGADRTEEAERQYRRLHEHTPRDAEDRAMIAADLGFLLADQERDAEALPYLRDAFHRLRNAPDADMEELGLFAAGFADVLCALGLEREMDMMWDLLDRPVRTRRRAAR